MIHKVMSSKTIATAMVTRTGIRAANRNPMLIITMSLTLFSTDIATQVKFRKQEEIERGAEKLRADGFKGDLKILTSCPSCVQGLSRYNDDGSTQADYIVVEMARHRLGADWMENYIRKANNGGIERVLL